MNIDRHDLNQRVRTQCSDLFSALDTQRRYDLIVSNPPYVDAEDLASMPAEYQHEPQLALAAGKDGLAFARKILQQAPAYLSEEGALLVEVGNSGAALQREFPDLPFTWLDFRRGGDGVFFLTARQLREHLVCCNE
jgi:ribosomal protein L3 glutamine methyltransferase